jgi:hypothetical protein
MIVAKGALVLVALSLCGSAASIQSDYLVGPNVQVSLAQSTVQLYETQIAADPSHGNHLVAGAYAVRSDGSVDNIFYASVDQGRTWSSTLTVPVGTDPSCAIDLKGTAFVASIHDRPRPDGNTDSFLVVHRSADGGRTWTASSIAIDTRSVDRTYVTVDDSQGPFRGRVYVHGYLQQPRDANGTALAAAFVLYASSDGGASFTHAVVRPGTQPGTPWFFPANAVVSTDGTLVALMAELDKDKRNMFRGRSDAASAPSVPDGTLGVIRSRDGGETIEATSTITDVFYDWRVPQLSMSSLAIDRSAGRFRNRLYAVWPDARVDRRTQIFLSSSDDVGRTWSRPRIVSDDALTLKPGDRPNEFMPMVAVNKAGIVGISWYDRRDNADNLGYFARFAASLDGGATFRPSIRVSSHANLTDVGDTLFNSGDTAGLTADADGVFHPLWIDNRTGVHQMWTTTVKVRGPE